MLVLHHTLHGVLDVSRCWLQHVDGVTSDEETDCLHLPLRVAQTRPVQLQWKHVLAHSTEE